MSMKWVVGLSAIGGGIAIITVGFVAFIVPEPASTILGFIIILLGFFLISWGLGLMGHKTKKSAEEGGAGVRELKKVIT